MSKPQGSGCVGNIYKKNQSDLDLVQMTMGKVHDTIKHILL